MQAVAMSSVVTMPRASVRVQARRSTLMGKGVTGLAPAAKIVVTRKVATSAMAKSVIAPLNNDPFIGMLETPVTSSPLVAGLLSNLPAYRVGVSPVLRGVEVGLAHGFLLVGPFIKLGPLRDTPIAEVTGCLSAAGLVGILTLCLTIYGAVSFQNEDVIGTKTLSGRELGKDALQSADGWAKFTSCWLVGGLSGCAWGYLCTQFLPLYQ